MQLPGLIQFRLCKLTDKQLAESVAAGLTKMYQEPVAVPARHIPARPDEDFDLLVGELVVRFLEKTDSHTHAPCAGNCGMNYCDENGCTERKRVLTSPIPNDFSGSYNVIP